ncbi:MAG: ATPase P [Eggerthellaceae bacterium]|nr:ATPase P [Eggerthellaceae bacterium]
MLPIDIPGFDPLAIEHVLLDFNGTIAMDGRLVPGALQAIGSLGECAHVAVLTADTYGTVEAQCAPLGVEVRTFPQAGAAQFKEEYARSLVGHVAVLGNGRNDIGMFDAADLSIVVIDAEGACASLFVHADIVVRNAIEGLELLLHPDRIRATLRS